ncbi:hypothetical protein [Mesorhizobium sp.]|uniref:DUF6894 family protein n=1 Tax=Mesorhizobium sp. TaxID=1871066 RepID=UPI000FE94660|nr:hypothetical protein [Mesorhizobium sp.]RWE78236.1 MAG: hypothetical protein EOS42_05725 [Mesorhizobium sp.]TIV32304.1 MAG: hypothetical protein E5V90_03605 [Mesorhizobium sp.]
MPKYFFDFSDTGESSPDEAGTELASFEAAKAEAVRSLMEMTAEVPLGGTHRELTMTVRDESGRNLARAVITFEVRVLD